MWPRTASSSSSRVATVRLPQGPLGLLVTGVGDLLAVRLSLSLSLSLARLGVRGDVGDGVCACAAGGATASPLGAMAAVRERCGRDRSDPCRACAVLARLTQPHHRLSHAVIVLDVRDGTNTRSKSPDRHARTQKDRPIQTRPTEAHTHTHTHRQTNRQTDRTAHPLRPAPSLSDWSGPAEAWAG
jgi:hypothetical protein